MAFHTGFSIPYMCLVLAYRVFKAVESRHSCNLVQSESEYWCDFLFRSVFAASFLVCTANKHTSNRLSQVVQFVRHFVFLDPVQCLNDPSPGGIRVRAQPQVNG